MPEVSKSESTSFSANDATIEIYDDNVVRNSEKVEVKTLDPEDPTAVFWEGPDDPENPMNWSMKKKWLNLAVLSMLTFITPLGSSMFAPGIQEIMIEFDNDSTILATFIMSIYILGFTFGPLFIAPLSELYGRRILYNAGNLFFTVFTVGAALSNSIGMLMAFRFLMGLAGSVPLTIGSGSIADMIPTHMRARAISAWALGPLLGPCVGPVAGGYLIKAAGWRWVFWLIAILGGVFAIISFTALKETYPPVLLKWKAARLRKTTGNSLLRSKLETRTAEEEFKLAVSRPLTLLFTNPIVLTMSLYVAIEYGIMYLLITTFSFVYAEKYHFGEGVVGLTFVPAGIGLMIGVVSFGQISDAIVKRQQAQGIEHKPEVRLKPIQTVPYSILLASGLFLYGWATEKAVFWIVPMIGVVIFCAGLMGVMMATQNYLLDTYLRYAASVTAAVAVLRSLLGALLPLGALKMYNTLGLGWGNSLLGFISLGLVPITIVFFIFGERIRKKVRVII